MRLRRSNDNHRAYLHQITPGLRHATLRFAWYLAPTRFAAQLPEKLADLHGSRRRDGVADSQQSARGCDREIAVAVKHTVCQKFRRLAFGRQLQSFEVMK